MHITRGPRDLEITLPCLCHAVTWHEPSLYFTLIYWHYSLNMMRRVICKSTLHKTETRHSTISNNAVLTSQESDQDWFCHTLSHDIYLSIFWCLLRMGDHAVKPDEPTAPKMFSEVLFKIANTASVILDHWRGRKKAKEQGFYILRKVRLKTSDAAQD